jgi:hypothetical protein
VFVYLAQQIYSSSDISNEEYYKREGTTQKLLDTNQPNYFGWQAEENANVNLAQKHYNITVLVIILQGDQCTKEQRN